MPRYSDVVRDTQGNGLPGAFITVRNYTPGNSATNGTLATLTNDASATIANPITADDLGAYYFNVASGQYTLEFRLVLNQPALKITLIDTSDTTRSDLAVTNNALLGAGMLGFGPTVSYGAGTVGAYLKSINDAISFSTGVATFNKIEVVDLASGDTSPAMWLRGDVNTAWPGLLIENEAHNASSQVQLFWKRWDALGNPLVWQAAVDVDNNGGFKGLFNLEAIDIVGGSVIATPISMARTGEVGFGGLPILNIQAAFQGRVRSTNVGGAQFGRYEFGDGSAYLYGDSTSQTLGIFFASTNYANFTVNGLFPSMTNTFDLGSATFRLHSIFAGAADFSGSVKSSSATGGIGYATGAGGTATQATNKSTAVTLNKVCGQITLNNAPLASNTSVSFTLNNSTIAATDEVTVWIASGATADSYTLGVTAVGSGTCRIQLRNVSGGSLGEALVLGFSVKRAVAA